MYAQVSRQVSDLGDQAFFTRNFYADFITPSAVCFSQVVPELSQACGLLEAEVLFGQTLFRLVLSVLAIGLLLALLGLLFRQLIRSFRNISLTRQESGCVIRWPGCGSFWCCRW